MIVKIIPETEAERKRLKEEVYEGVLDYFIFGVRADEDGHTMDFHNWRGNHRYLLGSLNYFYETVNTQRHFEEMKELERKNSTIKFPSQLQMKDLAKNIEITPVEDAEEPINDNGNMPPETDPQEASPQEQPIEVEDTPPPGWELK